MTNICQENVRVLVVLQDVDCVEIWRHFGDQLNERVWKSGELNVLDASISTTDNALVVLIVHLDRNDWTVGFNAIELVLVWWQNRHRTVRIPEQAALGARNDNLGVSIDDAAYSLAYDEFFFAMLEPFQLINVLQVSRSRVDHSHGTISRTKDQ